MSTQLTGKAGAGILFGAALCASHVYVPSVIISQMKLQNFHMVATFLTASASSALIIAALSSLSLAARQPRTNSTNNWFSAYDGNLIGGAMVGIGMGTTGACPGTVLVQIATGIKSGMYVALGGLVGGILHARFGGLLKQARATAQKEEKQRHHTIDARYNLKLTTVLLVYELLCLAMIAGSVALGGLGANSPYLHPVAGGLLIGLAQAASLLLTGSPVGVSMAYEEAGAYFWYLFSGTSGPRPKVSAMTFAAGILAGGFAMARAFHIDVEGSDISVSPVKAVLGGFVMIVGSRLAGGCTSGHGISGMSAFSVSSVVTVAAMFAGGVATAVVLSKLVTELSEGLDIQTRGLLEESFKDTENQVRTLVGELVEGM